MRATCLVLLVLTICGTESADADDRVAPSRKVDERVTVRHAPSKAAKPAGYIPKGESAKLVKTIENGAWHLVELESGETGYVNGDWSVVLKALEVTSRRVPTVADIPTDQLTEGSYRIHMIDVGTGLAILVQGHDFNLLYDAGSNDPSENSHRVLAHLAAAIGPSGSKDCVPEGDKWKQADETRTIQHVIQSHPHKDQGSMLDYVVHCYDVANIWDSGHMNDKVFCRQLVSAIAEELGATYHTALAPPANRKVRFTVASKPKWNKKAKAKKGAVTIPEDVTWSQFAEGERIELGTGAAFTILNAQADAKDPNENSVVVMVELGDQRLLLTGDAVSSHTPQDPSEPAGKNEKHLIDNHADKIDVDILQVAHHGSGTSSRIEFLEKVTPSWLLVSSGPKEYSGVTLPIDEVLDALRGTGATLLETYKNDKKCPENDPVGPNKAPGGCDSHVLELK